MKKIKPSSHPSTNQKIFKLITATPLAGRKILDVGAGRGFMAQWIGETARQEGQEPGEVLVACDLFPEFFQYDGIACCKVAFMNELPFPDAHFDTVYAIEVLEHLRSPYDFIRETFRVLRPGGRVILSVPNVLSLTSRFSYLFTGFFQLFGPISLQMRHAGNLSGHIMPLSYYYIDYGLRMEGYADTALHIDRLKSSALVLYFLMFPLLRLASWRFSVNARKQDAKKGQTVFAENQASLSRLNHPDLLCARSAIVVGCKKDVSA